MRQQRVTVPIYVVIDETGEYSVSSESIGQAREFHADEWAYEQLAAYKIEFTADRPGDLDTQTVRVEAPPRGPIVTAPAYGAAERLKDPEDDNDF